MSSAVLDASALLAWLQGEPGTDLVTNLLADAVVSAVNWAEVGQKIARANNSPSVVLNRFTALGVTVVPFTSADALTVAELWDATSAAGLSLGDRACLALARQRELPACTSDQSWSELDVGVTVKLIR